jgi:hypothetical protein
VGCSSADIARRRASTSASQSRPTLRCGDRRLRRRTRKPPWPDHGQAPTMGRMLLIMMRGGGGVHSARRWRTLRPPSSETSYSRFGWRSPAAATRWPRCAALPPPPCHRRLATPPLVATPGCVRLDPTAFCTTRHSKLPPPDTATVGSSRHPNCLRRTATDGRPPNSGAGRAWQLRTHITPPDFISFMRRGLPEDADDAPRVRDRRHPHRPGSASTRDESPTQSEWHSQVRELTPPPNVQVDFLPKRSSSLSPQTLEMT